MDELPSPKLSTKVIGHQWYWTYEATDLLDRKEVTFDSYMINEADLSKGGRRLLEVDNRLHLSARTATRMIITAVDVLHSWAVPALGVKMDACPGRLNQVSLFVNRPGVYYGQCSELCGINHSFMPIAVDIVTPSQYKHWLRKAAPMNFFQLIESNELLCLNLTHPEYDLVTRLPHAEMFSLPEWLSVSIGLFFVGLFGMAVNYKNFLVTMLCVEIMYLGAVTSFVLYGLAFHDLSAAIYALLILIFAACESALGLGLLVAAYRFGRTIGFSSLTSLGG